MKKIKFIPMLMLLGLMLSCKDQLDVKNPNQPTTGSADTESGLLNLAQGAIYVNGFYTVKYGGFYGTFWGDPFSYHEIMGDNVGVEAANQRLNEIGVANYVIMDDGSKVINPNSPKSQIEMIRQVNINANASDNPLYYEWAYMYSLNSGANNVLALIDKTTFTGDAESKKNALRAWAYWWKGYAYGRIGSIYYAGIINDEPTGTNDKFVSKEAIIAESNANYDKAAAALSAVTSVADYSTVIGKIIPSFFQVGKGGVLTPDMWKRNINSMKARNILVNTPVKDMSAAQWASIIALTKDGVTATDKVFTARSNETSDFIGATGNTPSALSTGITKVTSFKISERLVQDFKKGDKRLENNFAIETNPWIGNNDRGNIFNTRYGMIDGGKGLPGVVVLGNKSVGEYEFYMATTYEENQLTMAEAMINSGDIEGGLKIIDAVRKLQGAGLPAVAGTGLTLASAKEEIRSERRVVLPFRGLAFYDARRWGVINDVSAGGGRTNAVVVSKAGAVNTKATINYNFLDYWDVPANELAYNKAGDGSVAVQNPKGL
ncbi:RagB/SusD family nutrient uptake outer membrane protein [Dyadobacter luticola]|uniref:RagB/SusD family nutrient uptake outer membrane protein n=1 Tax=Dyadobacter luticola TaxID=1979387 RepID=A0A5R9KSV5_9BACT|nr:RagB/SusD family nutrient uptake outer membrane protein [Dyadobacter luticola]TLU99237.1 RagB/SusD family nutrient uptake outer membrane protein [Dyadobacter luticola]